VRPLSRRAVLRGLGGVTIGLPFLGAMQGTARAVDFPKRLVIFFSANGTIPGAWTPSGGEYDFAFGPILSPLEPHKGEVIVIDGVDNEAAHHGPGDGHQTGIGTLLTGTELNEGTLFCEGACDDPSQTVGWGGGISVDQHIANEISKTTTTKFGSLELGVQVNSANIWSRMSYLAGDQPVPPRDDPAQNFDDIFGDLTADPFGLATLRAKRHRVLDAVMEDYALLNKTLGAEDRHKLEAHLTAVAEVEKRLDVINQLGGACQLPDVVNPGDIYADENFPEIGRLQMDLLVMSLACDLTRVGSIQWSTSVSNKQFGWLGISEGHHDLSHDGDENADSQAKLVQINTWYAEQFAYLLQKMKDVPEGEGTMLDNTAVLWVNELGIGNTHSRRDQPFVLAGSCGGYFKTGRYLNFDGGKYHNDLLVSLCHAMDFPLSTFGNAAYCSGSPLPGLTG
jgi:hypothetical protein